MHSIIAQALRARHLQILMVGGVRQARQQQASPICHQYPQPHFILDQHIKIVRGTAIKQNDPSEITPRLGKKKGIKNAT